MQAKAERKFQWNNTSPVTKKTNKKTVSGKKKAHRAKQTHWETLVLDRNARHHVTPRIRVLIYKIGSKLGYKTNGRPEGERTSKTKSIGFIVKVQLCMYSTNLQKFLRTEDILL